MAQAIADRVVDLRELARLPAAFLEGFTGGTRDKAIQQLSLLIDAILSADGDSAKLSGISFDGCYQMARDHRSHWTDGSVTTTFARLIFSVEAIVPFLNARNTTNIHNAQINFYGKFGNKLSNVAADAVWGRTSRPYYTSERGTYPPKKPGDHKIVHEANRALDFFGMGPNKHAYRVAQQYYHTPQSSIDLFHKTGLVDRNTACDIWDIVFTTWNGLNVRGPDTRVNLGALIHNVPEDVACLYIIMIACRGCFWGPRTWPRMSKVLVQGGWPWLRRYTKAFAKSVFTVMVSLLAGVETGIIKSNFEVVLMDLARTLVGRPGQMWRVRQKWFLKGKKIRIAAVPRAKKTDDDKIAAKEGTVPAGWLFGTVPQTLPDRHEAVAAAKVSEILANFQDKGAVVVSTTEVSTTTFTVAEHCIILGQPCNHGVALQSSMRVRVAHSLREVSEQIGDWRGVIVALTLGDAQARTEVELWAVGEGVLSVKRAEDQCIYCACRVAHATAALLVIG